MLDAAPKAINRPRHDDIDLALSNHLDQAFECGTIFSSLSAADAVVDQFINDLPVGSSSDFTELLELIFGVLMGCGNAGIDERAASG